MKLPGAGTRDLERCVIAISFRRVTQRVGSIAPG